MGAERSGSFCSVEMTRPDPKASVSPVYRSEASRRFAFSAASDAGNRATSPSMVFLAAPVCPSSICELAMLSIASGTDGLSG